eukprot:CAMPEP_0171022776 /NCGR_PEP_ID=MMETSP0736-20130129/31675_1 /TAXON_ID=186038 /ORGANISM="Fragilariopsis kerguelensis, Strain L26-C5" /LENGTH=187 /DNA_ID=CAMNT_0011461759 /DNA_START=222 /DNA_END=781 /DNA_ORIENTATION=+
MTSQLLLLPSATAATAVSSSAASTSSTSNNTTTTIIPAAPIKNSSLIRRKKRPKNMPTLPLSAYNIFFREERQRYMATMNRNAATKTTTNNRQQQQQAVAVGCSPSPRIKKMSFEQLGKVIGTAWRTLPPHQKHILEAQAEVDRDRYNQEMIVYQNTNSTANQQIIGTHDGHQKTSKKNINPAPAPA